MFKLIKHSAPLFGCEVIDIPDEIPSSEKLIKRKFGKGHYMKAKKRPCDCILVTPRANILLELKTQDVISKQHQRNTSEKVNKVNGLFFTLRKKTKAKREQGKIVKIETLYSIDQWMTNTKKTNRLKTDNIENVFKYFKERKK